MGGARPRNVATAGPDFILCIGYLCAAAGRLGPRSLMHMQGASGAGRIVVSAATLRPFRVVEGYRLLHAIPVWHCGTFDMADNKSQFL